jgi:hypothetical protein
MPYGYRRIREGDRTQLKKDVYECLAQIIMKSSRSPFWASGMWHGDNTGRAMDSAFECKRSDLIGMDIQRQAPGLSKEWISKNSAKV